MFRRHSLGALVIGAGPAGLAVTQCLKKVQVEAHLVDSHGVIGGAYSRMYPRITLSSPASYLSLPETPIQADAAYVSAAEYQTYLQSYAAHNSLTVERRRVIGIGRADGEFIVEFDDEPSCLAYKTVVVATGMCDHPVFPDIVGLPRPPAGKAIDPEVLHSQDWKGPSKLSGKRVLIVGGGMRAVEIAEECASSGLKPIVSVRSGLAKPLPRSLFGLDPRYFAFPILHHLPLGLTRRQCIGGWRFRGIDQGFGKHVSLHNIVIKPGIRRMDGRNVHFQDRSVLPVDTMILATGYRYDMQFLPPEIPRSAQGYPLLADGECRGWPGLFVVGVPCALRADSHFIHGMAADAPVVARKLARRLAEAGSGRAIKDRSHLARPRPTELSRNPFALPVLSQEGPSGADRGRRSPARARPR